MKMNRKNIFTVIIFIFFAIFVFGCDITLNGNNLLATLTPTISPTIPITPIIVTNTDNSFDCYVNVDALNTRSCADSSCSTIKVWAIKNQKIHIESVIKNSIGEQWGLWSGSGWIRLQYCTTIK
jgi:hypothetical protein